MFSLQSVSVTRKVAISSEVILDHVSRQRLTFFFFVIMKNSKEQQEMEETKYRQSIFYGGGNPAEKLIKPVFFCF